MRHLTFFILMTFGFASLGGIIQKGATVHVKKESIWFQGAAALAHWQVLKKSGKTKALADYEDKMLSNRDAWQFMGQLPVKVLSYASGKQQVNVEMTDPGRLQGTKWWIDASVLVQ